MAPSKKNVIGFRDRTITTVGEARAKYTLKDLVNGRPQVAAWNGHEFEVVSVELLPFTFDPFYVWIGTSYDIVDEVPEYHTPKESGMVLHYPFAKHTQHLSLIHI